jgi:hypothetical protein
MLGVRRASVLIALILCASPYLGASEVPGPLVVVYSLPVAHASDDDAEVGSDFDFYDNHIRAELTKAHPEVTIVTTSKRRLVLPNGAVLRLPKSSGNLGYLLAKPHAKPRLLVGVQTESDFAVSAAKYFGWPPPPSQR